MYSSSEAPNVHRRGSALHRRRKICPPGGGVGGGGLVGALGGRGGSIIAYAAELANRMVRLLICTTESTNLVLNLVR
jgi:hypothetical protein